MSTWKIHEVAEACAMTTSELSQWISRNYFKPSSTTRRGLYRLFDWRDLACLAVMNALRKHSLSINATAQLVSELRDDLYRMDQIPESGALYFFVADWARRNATPTVGLVSDAGLANAIRARPASVVVVNVAKVYDDALATITAASREEVRAP